MLAGHEECAGEVVQCCIPGRWGGGADLLRAMKGAGIGCSGLAFSV